MTSAATARAASFELEPFSYAEAVTLMRELGLAEPVAVTLVRRGYRTLEAARAFLEASEHHEPELMAGMADAVALVREAIAAGRRITVHGDYDADGVCATAILIGALRELGADCDWYIPDRAADGYGLSAATVEALAARGTRLLITVDCGIGSAAEIARARELGIEAVVTDHHQPGETLPACPVLHPALGDYPCPDLCGAGVAYKLAEGLLGGERAEAWLDLVALATVADMVPLQGENRSLVRRGLAAARRARRPGLRALMAVASVVPETLDEGDLAFRLAPRINASGRLYRADAGVELLLCDDELRAGEIATELDRANHERRETEAAVLADAERELAALPQELKDAPAMVLWGRGWHPGVVGICASRMVERHGRPAILIAVDAEGRCKGSGRGVPGFDLLAALDAAGEHLLRYGGHRAAAGLELAAEALKAFRAAFIEAARAGLAGVPLDPAERVDAVVGGESLGFEVAGQLAKLAPFGKGNPEVRWLVPSARLGDVRPLGEGERHSRFSLASGPARASGVAFGVNGALAAVAEAGPVDLSLKLELNHWNGAVEPRVVLGRLHADEEADAPPAPDAPPPLGEVARRLDAELAREPGGWDDVTAGPGERELVARERASGVATVAALASTGESVLVVAADALWRRALVERAARPARFGGGMTALIASRASLERGLEAAEEVLTDGGVALTDWPALAVRPGLAARFTHVVVADPAPSAALERVARCAGPGGGFLHVFGERADAELAIRALALSFPDRALLGSLYRALRDGLRDGAPLGVWWEVVAPALPVGAVELVARGLRVLADLGVVRVGGEAHDRVVEAVSSESSKLEECESFGAYRDAHEECVRFLKQGGKPS